MLSKHNIDMVSTRESLKVVNTNTESLDFEELESVMWRKVRNTTPIEGRSVLCQLSVSAIFYLKLIINQLTIYFYVKASIATVFPRSWVLVDEFEEDDRPEVDPCDTARASCGLDRLLCFISHE